MITVIFDNMVEKRFTSYTEIYHNKKINCITAANASLGSKASMKEL